MNTSNIIEINHISKKFDNFQALKDISFALKPGEIGGFLGPSGAGKTTTIKILTGQLTQTSGESLLLGMDTRKINASIYSQIGIVTDNSGLYERLQVFEYLKFFCQLLNVNPQRAQELLKRVGLENHKKKKISNLSRGMKQRLTLARAILHNPRVLFLDEPTSGLDPKTTLDIHRLLLELKSQGTAIFLTTHNMEEASKLCDHVSLLNDGVIAEAGNPKELCIKYNTKKKFYVTLNNGEVSMFNSDDASIDQMAALLKSGSVAALHSSEPTLETVFLEVTGRELQ